MGLVNAADWPAVQTTVIFVRQNGSIFCSSLAARSMCINKIREQSKIIKKTTDLDYEFY